MWQLNSIPPLSDTMLLSMKVKPLPRIPDGSIWFEENFKGYAKNSIMVCNRLFDWLRIILCAWAYLLFY